MLVRLLYASRVDTATTELIESIVAQSRARNAALGITGILCHGSDVFMQVLEGGREVVNTLYGQIVTDRRHRDVTLLDYAEITERRFTSWTMGQVNLTRINPSIVLKYSDRPVLDPFSVSGRASMAMLDDLIATASIATRNT